MFFSSTEQLVPGDTDHRLDVYQRSYDAAPGVESIVTREVSTGPTGGNDAYPAFYDGASESGGRVYFSTQEPLVAGDRDRAGDVYMREPGIGLTVLISQGAGECSPGCGNGTAEAVFAGAMPDGSEVFFETDESLTPADGDGSFDVYERNVTTGETVLVSRGASTCAPGCGNGSFGAQFAGVSEDGKKVFFTTAESLASGDGNSHVDIYERNLATGETILVSGGGHCPLSEEGDCDAVWDNSSPDGSSVYFHTVEQISAQDHDESSDVYAWSGGAATLVSTGPMGSGTATSTFVGASDSGQKVFFQTAEALVPQDGDSASDIYERDLATSETFLVSQGAESCAPCGNGGENAIAAGVSTDGDKVFFQSAEALASGGRAGPGDVYVRDLAAGTTTLISAAGSPCAVPAGCGSGTAGATLAAITPDGARAFITTKESLAFGDLDGSTDVYARDLSTGTTVRVTGEGICPLSGERGCDAVIGGVSPDGAHVFFLTTKRLAAEDVDSEADVYEAALEGGEWKMRLVSVGNSLTLGPATPVLIGTDPGSPGVSTSPTLLGRGEAGTAIKVYASVDCSGAPVATGEADGDGEFGIPVSVEAESTGEFRATATDLAGDTSGCSGPVSYRQAEVEGGGGEAEEGGGGDPVGAGDGGQNTGSTPVGSSSSSSSPPKSSTPGLSHPTPAARPVPQAQITFSPAGRTKRRRPVFRFTDMTEQTGITFLCKVDGHRWLGCRSPRRLPKLGLGHHVFQVLAVGPTGERQEKPAKRTFKVVKP
ncbi:MAG: Ig-like domain-containing protein [Solirubrobacterales bacterium]